jgi:hypothetical protein
VKEKGAVMKKEATAERLPVLTLVGVACGILLLPATGIMNKAEARSRNDWLCGDILVSQSLQKDDGKFIGSHFTFEVLFNGAAMFRGGVKIGRFKVNADSSGGATLDGKVCRILSEEEVQKILRR